MTNEQKAREIASLITSVYGVDIKQEIHSYSAAMQTMQWKDEQHKDIEEGLRGTINALDAKLQKANESGMYYFDQCNIQKQKLIEKACEWLNGQSFGGWIDEPTDEFIEEFKQAMKGE